MKVLIADDDPSYRRLLETILKYRGYEILEAPDGQTAWNKLQSENIPFVLTDWMMPGLDGPTLIQKIRQAQFPHYTYIILLTGRDGRSDIVDGLQSGADDYIIKPFDLGELRARVAIGERILTLEMRLRDTMKKLEQLATYDNLTGLFNRRALYEQANRQIARAQREGSPLSAIMIDVDFFKQVNDSHGHLVGDQALMLLATLISRGKREYDLAGRWGGEEFLIILPGATLDEAQMVAERLRAEINLSPIRLALQELLYIHASFGVALLDLAEKDDAFQKLVLHADIALYRAKNSGRDRVCVFSLPN